MGFAFGALAAKLQAGEIHEVLRLADRVVTLADGDTTMGSGIIGSPLAVGLAFRAIGRWAFDRPALQPRRNREGEEGAHREIEESRKEA